MKERGRIGNGDGGRGDDGRHNAGNIFIGLLVGLLYPKLDGGGVGDMGSERGDDGSGMEHIGNNGW